MPRWIEREVPPSGEVGRELTPAPSPAALQPVPLQEASSEVYEAAGALFARVGYTESGVAARREAHASGWDKAVPIAEAIGDALDLCIVLFTQGRALPWAVVRTYLTPGDIGALKSLGLVRTDEAALEQCAATVQLYPLGPVLVASDRVRHTDGTAVALVGDSVYPAFVKNTQRFLSVLPRTPCDEFLELCAGTGVAALAMARLAGRAWAADIAARATRFAEFNIRLNGLGNVVARQGDLYHAVEGETFDRIAAHPPYVPAFRDEVTFRDGGEDGERITRGIVAGLPTYLRPGGRFYCVCVATDRTRAPLERRIREWLGDAQGEFDVVLGEIDAPQTPVELYAQRAVAGANAFADLEMLLPHFARLQVTGFVYCVMVLQRLLVARSAITVRRRMGPATHWREFEWLLARETAAADPTAAPLFDDAVPRLGPRTTADVVHTVGEGGLAPSHCVVRTTWPFAIEGDCPPWTADFLRACDGATTVRGHLRRLVESGVLPGDTPLERFAGLVRELVNAGVLETTEAPFPAVA